jgi:glucose-1-phosphate cytidylyltransferase
MKVVILAGGLGTRISEETDIRPKPMVEIGGKPILWHIMKIYASQGFNEFVVCLGYRGYVIKEYFANLFLHQSDITIDLENNKIEVHNRDTDNWKITLVDTGRDTMTGGRIKRIQKYIGQERFMLTYGDGLSNIALSSLIEFHESHGKACTVTSVKPDGRFGVLGIDDNHQVYHFNEKSADDVSWINGGFFVCEPNVFDLIENDQTIWERTPLESLAQKGELLGFKHHGFWKPMDSLKDKNDLNTLWDSDNAPWKIWT